jgi:hypothetical protein
MRRTRRTIVATLAGLAAGAGCLGGGDGSDGGDPTEQATVTPPTTATPTPTPTPTTTPTPTPSGYSVGNLRALVTQRVNGVRGGIGLDPLEPEADLQEATQGLAAAIDRGNRDDLPDGTEIVRAAGCEGGTAYGSDFAQQGTQRAPNGDGIVTIDSVSDVARFAVDTWANQRGRKGDIYEADDSRLGVGVVVSDPRVAIALAFCE